MEEEEPPILEPTEDVVGDRSGKKLLYTRKDGMLGSIFFDPNSVQLTSTRAVVSPYGTNEEYAILLKRILNPEVLTREVKQFTKADAEEEPPILEPNQFIVGSRSGKELLYTRKDGSRGVIYFDPNSVQLTPTRAVISPYGTDEEYAILRNKILNPEVLDEIRAVPDPPKPWASAEFEPGMRVVIEEVPLDSYEAAQIMRKLKPDLGPFEILESLKYNHETILQGYDEPQAKDIKEDLEDAGCTVYLQSIIPEREPQPEPLVAEPGIQIARPPTETEFALIRNARDNQYDSIKALVESAPLELNARDQSGRPLIFRMRSPQIVGLLIDHGADIHARDMQGNTILHQGAMQTDVCQMLIQFGVDIDARGEDGHTPLTRAAQLRLYPLTKTLAEQGADIHSKNDLGEVALQLAERHQDSEGNKIADLLRQYGAGPQPVPQIGRPPTEEEFGEIRWADESNSEEIEKLIRAAPIDVNARDKSGIPLVGGVQSPRILGFLIDQGADIHAKGLHGRSILHGFKKHGANLNPDVCKMLIQFGADIDARSEQGQTPLICAAQSGKYEVARILIESGADIHVSPEHGRTALEEARDHRFYGVSASEVKARDGCAKIAALLHELGAGTEPALKTGRPPTEDEFYKIRCAENPEDFFRVDELFKTAQIDINACDQLGNPIFFQVRSPEILGLLMDQGVDILSNNASKENALHYCHREVSPDVCEMLIQFGVDINAVDDQGETPLIRAAAMGNYTIAKKLIEHGAYINYRTPYGETALLAAENNLWKNKSHSTDRAEDCPKIAALLRENGAT